MRTSALVLLALFSSTEALRLQSGATQDLAQVDSQLQEQGFKWGQNISAWKAQIAAKNKERETNKLLSDGEPKFMGKLASYFSEAVKESLEAKKTAVADVLEIMAELAEDGADAASDVGDVTKDLAIDDIQRMQATLNKTEVTLDKLKEDVGEKFKAVLKKGDDFTDETAAWAKKHMEDLKVKFVAKRKQFHENLKKLIPKLTSELNTLIVDTRTSLDANIATLKVTHEAYMDQMKAQQDANIDKIVEAQNTSIAQLEEVAANIKEVVDAVQAAEGASIDVDQDAGTVTLSKGNKWDAWKAKVNEHFS